MREQLRNEFFTMYCDVAHKVSYIEHFAKMTKNINESLSIFLLLFSAGNLAIWGWNNFPNLNSLWLSLSVIAQVLQMVMPKLPLAKRLSAFKYFRIESANLIPDIKQRWRDIDFKNYSENQISKSIKEFEDKYNAIDKLYLQELQLPLSKHCEKKAKESCKRYFNYHYGVKEII